MTEKTDTVYETGEENKLNRESTLQVVGIGASAGGLEALEQFFRNMPSDSGLSFVVVQHLSPDYKSLMVELLSKYTEMECIRITDGMVIEQDKIYLIPPKKNLAIFHDKLHLTDQEHSHGQGLNLPIDIFFRSLAKDKGEQAIGVVLSGTGSDGTLGIRAIKEVGGMVMVQDEVTAKFDGMPRSAIATGTVDYILPPEEMPGQLMKYIQHPFVQMRDSLEESPIIDGDTLSKILYILKERFAVDFTYYKKNTILRRLERRLSINQIEKPEAYIDYLNKSREESFKLYKEFLIGVTKFFRDPDAYDSFIEKSLDTLLGDKDKKQVRVWVVGCSTGEEAYSLAMVFKEYLDEKRINCNIKIFATDIDREAIEFASTGIYPESIAADVCPERLQRFFTIKDNMYQVNESIRSMVVFAVHNVIHDPPFSKIDMVSCKNMLIYVQPHIQQKIISHFIFSLVQDGILFLGSSESVTGFANSFMIVDSKHKIFQYLGSAKTPIISDYVVPAIRSPQTHGDAAAANNRKRDENDPFQHALNELVQDYIPPSIIIDENYNLVHVIHDANQYLTIPPGKVNLNIQNILHQDLSITITTAINKALRDHKDIVYKNYIFKKDNINQKLDIIVKPITIKKMRSRYILIIFDVVREDEYQPEDDNTVDIEKQDNKRIEDLEQELKYTRENLQATIEELAASNEELQATNEELIASNEELQSTNEELQSVNEELFTVNSEYQNKIEELTLANNDINNLLKSTEVGTLFLDMDLRVRMFTDNLARVINLMDQDVGRHISHISHNLEYDDFIPDLNDVLETLQTKGMEVKSSTEHWYYLKIIPYRTMENIIDGIVVTLQDLSERKKYETRLEQERDLLIRVLENSPMGKTMVDCDGKIVFANRKAERLLGLEESRIRGMTYNDPKWKITDEEGKPIPDGELPFARIMKTKEAVRDFVHAIEWPDGKRIVLKINGAPMFDDDGSINGAVFVMEEVKSESQERGL